MFDAHFLFAVGKRPLQQVDVVELVPKIGIERITDAAVDAIAAPHRMIGVANSPTNPICGTISAVVSSKGRIGLFSATIRI